MIGQIDKIFSVEKVYQALLVFISVTIVIKSDSKLKVQVRVTTLLYLLQKAVEGYSKARVALELALG